MSPCAAQQERIEVRARQGFASPLRALDPMGRRAPPRKRQRLKKDDRRRCPRACAQPECTSTQNSSPTQESIFFNPAQPLEASTEIAFAYGRCSSGPIIHAYVGGNPVSDVDPNGLQRVRPLPPLVVPPSTNPDPDRPPPPSAPNYTPIPPSPSLMCQMFPLACAAVVIPQIICKESDDADRCKQRLTTCRQQCQAKWERGDPPFSGSDVAGRMRRCIRECMEAGGCFNF